MFNKLVVHAIFIGMHLRFWLSSSAGTLAPISTLKLVSKSSKSLGNDMGMVDLIAAPTG